MDGFSRQLLTEWRKLKLPFEGASLLIAVSGGADSVSLVTAFAELKARKKINNRVVVAHYDHNLRGDSIEDRRFVEELSQNLGFEFTAEKASPSSVSEADANLEQSLRVLRYGFLLASARTKGCEFVLLAHTLNDQAETFLMNLIRGSGPDGLRAMPTKCRFDVLFPGFYENKSRQSEELKGGWNPEVIRPLLSWAERKDTEAYSRAKGVSFREDEMNRDLAFRRVLIRKRIIPQLSELNPRIVRTLARTAKLMGGALEIPERISTFDFTVRELKISDFDSETREIQTYSVRKWLEAQRGGLRRITSKHIEAVVSLMVSKKSGRLTQLPNGEVVVKQNGSLVFRQFEVEK